MVIICRQCGYENPEGSTVCEICAEPLRDSGVATVEQVDVISPDEATADEAIADEENEYFVLCPESQTKTIVPAGNVTAFYCEGCKKQHEIDGFLWNIEKKTKENVTARQVNAASRATAVRGDNLWLEEVNSHVRIDIDKAGGTLGRYGKYGADFFQSRGLLMVSGEHCSISYEFGNWVIRHMSKTNQTIYNNAILGANEPNLLEDGKVLTLANAVSFIVRIG